MGRENARVKCQVAPLVVIMEIQSQGHGERSSNVRNTVTPLIRGHLYTVTPLIRGHLYTVTPLIRGHLYTVNTSDQGTPLYS